MLMLILILLFGALAMLLGVRVRDSIERQTLNTWLFKTSIWATVVFGVCLAIMTSIKPEGLGFILGSLYVLVYFVGVIGVFALPVLIWIISIYAFGYLYWLIRR